MKLIGQTKGVHSTWLYCPEAHCMFDAGEGCSTYLSTKVYGLRKLFITHGHVDHISGLRGLLALRERSMSEKAKAGSRESGSPETEPLDIYYAKGTRAVRDFRTYIGSQRVSVRWHEMAEDESVELHKNLRVQAFRTRHYPDKCPYSSLGFSVYEKRSFLNPKYDGLPGTELAKVRTSGTKDFTRNYRKNVLAYTGDTLPLDPTYMRPYWEDADTIIHDATFLDPTDQVGTRHCSADQVLNVLKDAKPGWLVGCHVSPRYTPDWRQLQTEYAKRGLHLLHPNKVLELDLSKRIIRVEGRDGVTIDSSSPKDEVEMTI